VDLAPGDYLKLAVTDTGNGIEPDIIESIFEPYFTTKQPGEGTGLGLPVVHGIVKQFGGEITVESEPGNGTTFAVYLPVLEKQIEFKSETAEILPVGKERVLLVDDEVSIVNMCKQMLAGFGYNVTARTSSIEALELFRNRPGDFDLIFTDMTGDRLASELIKIRSDIPVILCTGYSKKCQKKMPPKSVSKHLS
jgi:CheY-like chemotaxis protein